MRSPLVQKKRQTGESDAANRPDLRDYRAALALTADSHQTARVWHFYAYPTPWSRMPWARCFYRRLPVLGLWFLAQRETANAKSYSVTKWLALGSALSAIVAGLHRP